jgi:hypothetical protein
MAGKMCAASFLQMRQGCNRTYDLPFALPPAEAAFHPSDEEGGAHELYFMCDDLKAEIASLAKKGVKCAAVREARW